MPFAARCWLRKATACSEETATALGIPAERMTASTVIRPRARRENHIVTSKATCAQRLSGALAPRHLRGFLVLGFLLRLADQPAPVGGAEDEQHREEAEQHRPGRHRDLRPDREGEDGGPGRAV